MCISVSPIMQYVNLSIVNVQLLPESLQQTHRLGHVYELVNVCSMYTILEWTMHQIVVVKQSTCATHDDTEVRRRLSL